MKFNNWFKKKPTNQPVQTAPPLEKTRAKFWDRFNLDKKAKLEDQLLSLKKALLATDMGTDFVAQIMQAMSDKCFTGISQEAMLANLKELLSKSLTKDLAKTSSHPTQQLQSILVVGINGAGKTTTIGKLACYFKDQDKKIMLAAGDTFRAAAIEQLKIWAERAKVAIVSQHLGSDSASVIFDALQSAKAKQLDLLIADTAGRLHTQTNLMQELIKIKKVMQKADENAPSEIWLIIDGTLGQSSLAQAKEFHQALQLTGLIITKLDGSAKGGAVFAISKALGVPIKFIGTGETAKDLKPFNSDDFIASFL